MLLKRCKNKHVKKKLRGRLQFHFFMSQYRQSRILIKVISHREGGKFYAVDPNMPICTLRQFRSEDRFYFYKGVYLVEDFSFNFYQIGDGDIICSHPHIENTKLNRILEFEKIRLIDIGIRKLRGNFRLYNKAYNEWIKVHYEKLFVEAPNSTPEFIVPPKLDAPSTTPLPAFWLKPEAEHKDSTNAKSAQKL